MNCLLSLLVPSSTRDLMKFTLFFPRFFSFFLFFFSSVCSSQEEWEESEICRKSIFFLNGEEAKKKREREKEKERRTGGFLPLGVVSRHEGKSLFCCNHLKCTYTRERNEKSSQRHIDERTEYDNQNWLSDRERKTREEERRKREAEDKGRKKRKDEKKQGGQQEGRS